MCFIFFSDVLFYEYVIGNFFLTYEDHLFSLNLKNAIILSSRFLAWMLKEKLENRPFSRSKDFHFHFYNEKKLSCLTDFSLENKKTLS